MERFNDRAKEEDQGALALVLDLAKEFERVSFFVVWSWATDFSFPRKILRVLCGNFEHQRRVQFVGCAGEPLTTITAILPRSKWSCLLLRIVLQDAFSEIDRIDRTSRNDGNGRTRQNRQPTEPTERAELAELATLATSWKQKNLESSLPVFSYTDTEFDNRHHF